MQIRRTITTLMLASCMAAGLPATAFAGQEEVDAVNKMIEDLPEVDTYSTITTLTPEEIQQVKDARDAYISLDMSEKVQITNYVKLSSLYDSLINNGSITDESQAAQEEEEYIKEQQDAQTVSANSEKTTKYVFQLSGSGEEASRTVIIHYTSDIDGDGEWDEPERIVLTDPKGNSTPITKAITAMNDETMNIQLTWEPNFLQLDIASALSGKWTITTSSEATFTSTRYLGLQDLIPSQDETEDKADSQSESREDVGYDKNDVAPTETETLSAQETEMPEPVQKGPNIIKSILGIGMIVVLIGGLIVAYRKMKASTDRQEEPEEEEKQESEPAADEYERLKKEYQEEEEKKLAELEQENDMTPIDDDDDDVNEVISQPDLDDDDETIEEHMEGDTDLLNRQDAANRARNDMRRKRGSRFDT